MASPFVGGRTVGAGALTRIFTAAEITEGRDVPQYGERVVDSAGNEYIFLKGVASTVAGDPVVFNPSTFATTRLAGSEVGQVAIALGAVIANLAGWYLVYGSGSANVVATGGVRVYTSTVTGQLLATVVTGALVNGMFTLAGNGNTVTGTLQTVRVVHPYVDRASGSY